MDGALEWFSIDERVPPTDHPIIVERMDGKRDQVTVRDGKAYEWRYHNTDNLFATNADIKCWRGCTGFDF